MGEKESFINMHQVPRLIELSGLGINSKREQENRFGKKKERNKQGLLLKMAK